MIEYRLVAGVLGVIFDEDSEAEAKRRFDLFVIKSKTALAISEWQINQLKMQGKSVEKSMGEVDSSGPNFLRYENRIATWARRTPVLRRKKRHGNL